jgi:hypothetical protein
MSVLPAEVADHLDKVVAATRLLPSTDRVQALDTAVSVLLAEQAAATRELASDGSLDGSGCKTPNSWLRVHLRRGIGAHRITRRAELLPQLPGFGAAFAAGRVSEEHVDTVIRWTKPCGLTVIQDHEPTLVQLAEHASPRELEQALGVLADLANPDRDADQVAALADRFIRVHRLGELVQVDAMVEPALGEALKTAVEAGATLPTGIKPADDGRTLHQRRADAFGMIVLHGIATLTTPVPAGMVTGDSAGATAADTGGSGGEGGTATIADTGTSGNGNTGSTGTGAGASGTGAGVLAAGFRRRGRLRPQVAVTVSLEWLAGMPGAPAPLLAHFGAVPAPTAHRLVCAGDLTRVILDSATGLPLDVGRRARLAVRRQRRALATVFRCCAFPGCEVPFRFTEVHHRDFWCKGGKTDLDLLVPYCWEHHRFVHEFGFTVTRGPDGQLVHRRPDGKLIPDPAQPLRQAEAQLKLDIFGDPSSGTDPPDTS